jgi:hypothetical protein
MDAKNEIREFLTSRRAKITPDQVGLPIYGGNRRVPGLRREEVALLAGSASTTTPASNAGTPMRRSEAGRLAAASVLLVEKRVRVPSAVCREADQVRGAFSTLDDVQGCARRAGLFDLSVRGSRRAEPSADSTRADTLSEAASSRHPRRLSLNGLPFVDEKSQPRRQRWAP